MPFTGLQISQPGSIVDVDHEDYSGDGNDDGSSVAGVDDDEDEDL